MVLSLASATDIRDKRASWIPVRGYLEADMVMRPNPTLDEKLNRLPARSSLPFKLLSLDEEVGKYEPLDPKHNSVEIMREAAIRQLESMVDIPAWDAHAAAASLRPIVQTITEFRGRVREAEAARNKRIRELLDAGVRPSDITAVTDLHRSRVDQIRNEE